MRPHQFLEAGEVALLLLGHPPDRVAGAAAPQDGELAVIDADGAVLAGMVDPDHALDLRLGRRVAGQMGRAPKPDRFGHTAPRRMRVRAGAVAGRRARANTRKQIAAMISEANRLNPAIDTPNR